MANYTETSKTFVELAEDGVIHEKTITRVFRDGVEISKNNHRKVLTPDDAHFPLELKALKNLLFDQTTVEQQVVNETLKATLSLREKQIKDERAASKADKKEESDRLNAQLIALGTLLEDEKEETKLLRDNIKLKDDEVSKLKKEKK